MIRKITRKSKNSFSCKERCDNIEKEIKFVGKEQYMDENLEKSSEQPKEKSKAANTVKEVISFIAYIAVVFLLTYLVITYVGQRTEVSGSSMESTLSNGDNLIVDKISYRFKEPERFDIIVFPYQYEENTYYIKRIIGMPGETVQIDEKGIIYINGEELVESYGLEVIDADKLGLAAQEITLSEDEYFVLGDNRNNSSDSREPSVGNIKRENIIGKAWVRIYPFDEIGFIRHQ